MSPYEQWYYQQAQIFNNILRCYSSRKGNALSLSLSLLGGKVSPDLSIKKNTNKIDLFSFKMSEYNLPILMMKCYDLYTNLSIYLHFK